MSAVLYLPRHLTYNFWFIESLFTFVVRIYIVPLLTNPLNDDRFLKAFYTLVRHNHVSIIFGYTLQLPIFVLFSYSSSENISNHPLDFEKIKNDLTNLPERKKGFLLQALRWVSSNLGN